MSSQEAQIKQLISTVETMSKYMKKEFRYLKEQVALSNANIPSPYTDKAMIPPRPRQPPPTRLLFSRPSRKTFWMLQCMHSLIWCFPRYVASPNSLLGDEKPLRCMKSCRCGPKTWWLAVMTRSRLPNRTSFKHQSTSPRESLNINQYHHLVS
ncbi:hypothetical protein [Absidia glauca]|uniref:Uncharacterized protein n=1 Tax=Absidia glauca TaxID=4829 RepID=A0A168S8X6_ABSGL|nr:hypothetical protein [Absidia glauca]